METIFRVHVTPERVFVKISDKASYLNCEPIRKFFEEQTKVGLKRFIIDFKECSSMDSTFLGILVGLALRVRADASGGSVILLNLSGRNLETVCNLGIHQVAEVSSAEVNNPEQLNNLIADSSSQGTSSETIYNAHKSFDESE